MRRTTLPITQRPLAASQTETTPREELRSLHVRGFRRLRDVSLELRPLTVALGANGAGKSTLLEVFSLLAASARGDLGAALQASGGLGAVMTSGTQDGVFLEVERGVVGAVPLRYSLHFKPQGSGYYIAHETLSEHSDPSKAKPFLHIQAIGGSVKYFDPDKNGLFSPTWTHDPRETALSQVPRLYRDPESLRQTLAACQAYAPIGVGPQSPVRLPQAMQPTGLPGTQGETLISCLFNWREADPERFERFNDTLRAAFPNFESVSFPIAAAGRLQLVWKDRDFTAPFDISQLSEGTVRFLWLSVLLMSRELPAITLLDEPELSLHPELLSLLADLLREAAQSTHLIVATHSDRLVRFLKPEEILACDIAPDGGASFTWGDSLNLDEWLKDYSLDELWSMNLLGGRPQP